MTVDSGTQSSKLSAELDPPDQPLSAGQHGAIAELLALEDAALVGSLYARLPHTPEEIQEAADHRIDLERAYAANSKRTALADWRTWRRFCVEADVSVLPATISSLRLFLESRLKAGRRRATLSHYLWTLALVHRLRELPWPLDTANGRLMWKGICRLKQMKLSQHQKHGLTLDEVERMLAAMGEAPADLRDAAMLSLASEALVRPAELVAFALEDFTFLSNGSGRVRFERSKTDQEGAGALLAISADCVVRLRRWLDHAQITTGPIFRAIPTIVRGEDRRERFPGRYGFPLSTGDVQRIYKRRARDAGLVDTNISGHSPRIGSTQDMVAQGLSGPLIRHQGRWKSERMVSRYSEHLQADRGAMPQLLEMRAARKRAAPNEETSA
jgi:integrase